jgi:GR25 family glycosyltransferase involved in LPS biosynthesis
MNDPTITNDINTFINDKDNEYYVVLEDDLELFKNFKENLNKHCKIFEEQKLEHLSLGVFECNYLDQDKIKTNDIKIFQKDVFLVLVILISFVVCFPFFRSNSSIMM